MDDPLIRLHIDAAGLDGAPSRWPPSSVSRERLAPPHSVSCSKCGTMSVTTSQLDVGQASHFDAAVG
ncbi:hypothetical protein ACIREE_38800 [Streptomyces sp. NPDC102467]|uniref:hypothetical protein n=1 Tax=Streptomyces sp. NPDC102467 TaxID=3366179 RepID=UPI0037FECFB4